MEGFSVAWTSVQMLLEKIQDFPVYLNLTCFSRYCRELFLTVIFEEVKNDFLGKWRSCRRNASQSSQI